MNEWGDIAVISPASDIDIATVASLRDQLDRLITTGCRRIVVNCRDVSFIDSSGMALLLSRARRLAQSGGMLSVSAASPEVMRFIQIARLVDVLHVTPADRPALPVLAPDAMPRWSKGIAVKPGVEHLAEHRHHVAELLSGLSLAEADRFDLALAAGEALSNAYDHACGARGCTVSVTAYADRVVIEVCDCGCGFALDAHEEIQASEERGRGIRLMRMLTDGVEITRRPEGGTLVKLSKLLAYPAHK